MTARITHIGPEPVFNEWLSYNGLNKKSTKIPVPRPSEVCMRCKDGTMYIHEDQGKYIYLRCNHADCGLQFDLRVRYYDQFGDEL